VFKSISPWLLVFTGIVFNIASAVITHYSVELNYQKLNLLEQKIRRYDTFIDNAWRNKIEIDRKEEFYSLLQVQETNSSDTQKNLIKQYLATQLQSLMESFKINGYPALDNSLVTLEQISQLTNLIREKIVQSINDSYLEKLSVQQKTTPLKEKNALLGSIAIFLQITGLILVLARDFRQ
jgi:hypothetical protein